MVADKIFDLSISSQLVYQSDIPIKGKTFVKVFIDRVGEGTWEVIDGNNYQLINDSLVFTERPTGSLLIMQVATTPSELQQTPTDISLLLTIKEEIKTLVASLGYIVVVSDSISNVNLVAGSIYNVNTVASNITDVINVSDNIPLISTVNDDMPSVIIVANDIDKVVSVANSISDVSIVAGSIANVNLVAGSISNVNTVASNMAGLNEIVTNMDEILEADTNAQLASDSALLAQKWASNPEDVPVTTIPDKFSALHWAEKAREWAMTVFSSVTAIAGTLMLRGTNNEVGIEEIRFNTHQNGLRYNTGDGTLEIDMGSAGVTQSIGLESYVRIKASSTITNGQVIIANGAVGNSGVLTGIPATGTFPAHMIIGVATQDIPINGFGFVTRVGIVHDVNTNSWNEGDKLWYNSSVVGGLTNVEPTSGVKVAVAMVVFKSPNGSIFVRAGDIDENLYAKVTYVDTKTAETLSVAKLLHIQDQKTSGTAGGTPTAGAWNRRTLNSIVMNTITGASLSSNIITLPAGTYFVEATAPAVGDTGSATNQRHKVAIRKTDGSVLALGTSECVQLAGSSTIIQTRSKVEGRLILSVQTDIELSQWFTTTTSYAMGVATGIAGVNEVYSEIRIWKVS